MTILAGCILYTSGGDDIIYQDNNNLYLADFDDKNDKLILSNNNVKIKVLNNNVVYLDSKKGKVFFYGVEESKVDEWVKIMNLNPEEDIVYTNINTKEIYFGIPKDNLNNWVKLTIDQKNTLKENNPIQKD